MDNVLGDPSMSPAVTVMVLYERIEQIARRADRTYANCSMISLPHLPDQGLAIDFRACLVSGVSPAEMTALVSIYARVLETLSGSLPSHLDPWGIEQGTFGTFSPVVIYRHINHHGCVMLLYSLTAKTDFKAREKVIAAARALAELGPLIRGERGLKPIHASLLLMVNRGCLCS